MKRALVRAGALLVTSLKELNYAVQAFAMRKDLASGELYGLVNSKGLDSLLADHAYNNDLRLATPDSTVAKELRRQIQNHFPLCQPGQHGFGHGRCDYRRLNRLPPQSPGMLRHRAERSDESLV